MLGSTLGKEETMEIPVYLFTGFLESGKTKFIQETLEDERFNSGEKTLLLVCEEGEEEYDPLRFAAPNVYIHVLEDISELTPENMSRFQKQHRAERVIIEYNGMWMLDSLYNTMPKGWTVYQELMFADAGTFISYNNNMRALVVDKLKSCEMIVFNRAKPDTDKTEFHKIVRGVSRGADIAYEHPDGSVEYDDIEDPLPFDINAPVIDIADNDYALWYRDMGEELDKYLNKTIRFKGITIKNNKITLNEFTTNHHIMTCCVEDIAYGGLICISREPVKLKTKDWVIVRGRITRGRHKVYNGEGPIIMVDTVEPAEKPEQEVATFY